MFIYIVVILSALAANKIRAETILELEEDFNQQLVVNLLDSYREFAAAEVVLAQASEEEKEECSKKKKLYLDTLTEVFRQKGLDMSGYTGVNVIGREKSMPIISTDVSHCEETVNYEFYKQYVKDFIHDHLDKVSLTQDPEEILIKLKSLDEYQTFQRNLVTLQNNEIIKNALKSQHAQTVKEVVASTAQHMLSTRDTIATKMSIVFDYLKSKQNIWGN